MRNAGFSKGAIEAAWPSWWRDELGESVSGRAELRFALAKRLGLSPQELLGDKVRFLWTDSARFKHLTTETEQEKAALASFGMSIGKSLIGAFRGDTTPLIPADALRTEILNGTGMVELSSLVATCWAIGIPVIQLRVFPLQAKRMHAMVVAKAGRHAIIIGRTSKYPAPVAFTLAHELGHVMRGHLNSSRAVVDLGDPIRERGDDQQECEADAFALELLTGQKSITFSTHGPISAPSLASAVVEASHAHTVEPGTLALCWAYQTGAWAVAMSAMKFIYGPDSSIDGMINDIADGQLNTDDLSADSASFLEKVMG